MKNFTGVEEAIERMNVHGNKDANLNSSFGHAPLATPENVDLEYNQVRHFKYIKLVNGSFSIMPWI